MLVSWTWLRELVTLPDDVGPDDVGRALTGAGLEVEDQVAVGDGFAGVVIAEVVGKRRHPEADKLTLVDVITAQGGAATEVVCGAPNVPEPGGRVLWARPGARLRQADGSWMDIAPRAIRGVTSAGMLCSERELGLGDDHDGIIVLEPEERAAALGSDAGSALGLADVVYDIGVPANRADALGHVGVAREVAALCRGKAVLPPAGLEELTDPALDAAALVAIDIADPERCTRYVGRVIDGLTVRTSPRWMRLRLQRVGVRPLSNLVDITNYVMFETGQPLHAFDYAKVRDGRIAVRRARAGEKMTTLDDLERTLDADDLLICDGAGPVAIAGVMGGATSEVSDATARVLLESAHFAPTGVRRTARRLGLHSESSYRFERYVDPNGADRASARAARLMAELGGGRVARGVVDSYPRPARPTRVVIRPERATMLTGVAFDDARIRAILGSIQLDVKPGARADGGIEVECPTFRADLTREVDLIEELIRHHGFEAVPATLPLNDVTPARNLDRKATVARRALVGAGMTEVMLFGFTSPARIEALRLPADDRRAQPIALLNPLRADHAVMRTSLLPNLLGAVAYNLNRGTQDLSMFEVGAVFLRGAGELADEPRIAAGVLSGARAGWLGEAAPVDFFDAKGCVHRLLSDLLGPDEADAVEYRATAGIPYLHPGIAAEIVLPAGTVVGAVGEVHPETLRALDIEPAVMAFELDLEAFPPLAPVQMKPIPRHPAVVRDVSMFVAEATPSARVREIIAEVNEPLVERVVVLEDYRDPVHVPAGQKGMLWSVTYRAADRTLTDAEVDAAHEAIVARLLRELPAVRRA